MLETIFYNGFDYRVSTNLIITTGNKIDNRFFNPKSMQKS